VLEGVRQRLLDDAIGREIHARRQFDRLALNGDVDREPGRPHLLGELRDALQ
jgi:hypothetical protein